MSTRIKIALTIAVIAGAVVYMIASTVGGGEALSYFKHVEEVAAAPDKWEGRSLQLHGNVVAGSILKKPGALDYKFALHRGGRWLEVTYSGLVPDNFRDCAELVVEGQLQDEKTFAAKSISAKCPSRYDGERMTGCGEEVRDKVLAHRK